jgi:hypothetical protein
MKKVILFVVVSLLFSNGIAEILKTLVQNFEKANQATKAMYFTSDIVLAVMFISGAFTTFKNKTEEDEGVYSSKRISIVEVVNQVKSIPNAFAKVSYALDAEY